MHTCLVVRIGDQLSREAVLVVIAVGVLCRPPLAAAYERAARVEAQRPAAEEAMPLAAAPPPLALHHDAPLMLPHVGQIRLTP